MSQSNYITLALFAVIGLVFIVDFIKNNSKKSIDKSVEEFVKKDDSYKLNSLDRAANWILDRKYLLRNLISLLFISISIYKFTMIHPFTLADNRHYMFYAWNKVLKYRLVQLSLIPIYFIIPSLSFGRLVVLVGSYGEKQIRVEPAYNFRNFGI